jgi:peptidoglycan/LPS O-acetylase OafA/YrhL
MASGDENMGQSVSSEWHRDMTDSLSGNLHHIGQLLGELLRNPALWALAAGIVADNLARRYIPKLAADILGMMVFAAILYGWILLRDSGAREMRMEALVFLIGGAAIIALLLAVPGILWRKWKNRG